MYDIYIVHYIIYSPSLFFMSTPFMCFGHHHRHIYTPPPTGLRRLITNCQNTECTIRHQGPVYTWLSDPITCGQLQSQFTPALDASPHVSRLTTFNQIFPALSANKHVQHFHLQTLCWVLSVTRTTSARTLYDITWQHETYLTMTVSACDPWSMMKQDLTHHSTP